MAIFEATQQAGYDRLANFVLRRGAGTAYERNRNSDLGPDRHNAVSQLSPYLRHRLITEPAVLAKVLETESTQSAEKFIQEICWRTYWKGWLEQRPVVWQRYVQERDSLALLNAAQAKAVSKATRAATGIECFDHWVEELISTGYLHNHARMWFASIWIFTLNLPWQSGADFFMQHLADADAASNTLSWRWVAGLHTPGKHYVARADNIARYTQNRFNPRGQLNEDPQPLSEGLWHSSQATTPAKAFSKVVQLSVQSQGDLLSPLQFNEQTWLLLHDEDLSPEDWLVQKNIGGIIVLQSASLRSAQPLGQVAAHFANTAVATSAKRLQRHWQLPDNRIIECASVAHLAKQLDGHQIYGRAPLVFAWPQVGPLRDGLHEPLATLHSQGIDCQAVLRRWDHLAWPHATKGFFQFRTQIAQLLEQALD
jgi:deoxyribodipyrimidine photo-lyase